MEFINIKNKVHILICILLIIVLSGCKQPAQPHEEINLEDEQNILYSFENPITGQEFDIVHAYLLYENYFEAVKNNPDELPYKLFQEEIIKPVYETCFEGSEYADTLTVLDWVKESDSDSFKNQIASINKDFINETFEESLIKSSDILSSDKKTTVCVFPKNDRSSSEMFALETGKIIVLHTNPDNKYKSGMAHEYHHSVRIGKLYSEDYFLTGLDHLLLEGQAVMFETLVYPNLNHSHLVVSESFNKEYWSKIEPYLDSFVTREIHDEMIIGGSNGLPQNYGYSEGFKMIRSYLDLHPDMTVEEWTSKSPNEIFEESNYIANYQ